MKNKKTQNVFKIGSKTIDFENLEHYEAVSIAVVSILSITVGILYGTAMLS